jgi:hypothetical protein
MTSYYHLLYIIVAYYGYNFLYRGGPKEKQIFLPKVFFFWALEMGSEPDCNAM